MGQGDTLALSLDALFLCYSGRMEQYALPVMPAQEPLWTQDEAIAFEVAREAINHVMSIYTTQIADERRKPVPDEAKIAALSARRSELHRERTDLRLKDQAKIARVRQEYGAFVRDWNSRQGQLAAE
jgi:hypothetical protein